MCVCVFNSTPICHSTFQLSLSVCYFQSLSIQIVSDEFLGLSLLKRHQLVYLTLGDDMNKVS